MTYVTYNVTTNLMRQQTLRTPEQAREWLDRHGVPVSEWARANGFEPSVVFSLLSGRTRGRRGMAYTAAIALGLKASPTGHEEPPLVRPPSEPAPPAAVDSPKITGDFGISR